MSEKVELRRFRVVIGNDKELSVEIIDSIEETLKAVESALKDGCTFVLVSPESE